jgi:hypothetical protein
MPHLRAWRVLVPENWAGDLSTNGSFGERV